MSINFLAEHLKMKFNKLEYDIYTGTDYEKSLNDLLNLIPSPARHLEDLRYNRITVDRFYLLHPEVLVIRFSKYGIESLYVIHGLPDNILKRIRKKHKEENPNGGIKQFYKATDIEVNLRGHILDELAHNTDNPNNVNLIKEVNKVINKIRITEYSDYEIRYEDRRGWFR